MNVSWFVESWRTFCPSPWVDIILVLASVVCGIIVGGERQRREKPAGLRTMTLVCLGSALFTMLSFTFTSTTGDSGRVAAQIVTGIGFLGAGVILHGRRTVTGVTTAAGIWVAAAIGMAIGAGFPLAGLGLSLLVNRLLVLFFLYETRWHSDLCKASIVLTYAPEGGLTRVRLERVLADYDFWATATKWSETTGGGGCLNLKIHLGRIHLYELMAELADVPNVLSLAQEYPSGEKDADL